MSDHEYCLLGLIKFIYKIPKYANKNSAMDTTHTVIMSPIHSHPSWPWNKGHRNENERRGRKKKQTFVDSDNSEQSDNETSTQNNGGVRSRSTRKKPVALSVAKSRRSKRSRN